LVYATHAPVGLLTFNEVAASTWHQQALTKAKTKVRLKSGPQGDIFGGEVHDVQTARQIDRYAIREAWLSLMPVADAEIAISDDLMSELLERCSCFSSDLQGEVRGLIDDGVLENRSIRASQLKQRTKHVVQNGEVLRRLR
jgi:hypothetical protein